MRTSRRGLTLVELTIGLAFAMAVAAVIHRLLLLHTRVSHAQTERAGLQDNVRAGALVVAGELRDLGLDSVPALAGLGVSAGASSDIFIGQAGRVRYRAMQGLGFTCSTPTGAEIRLRAATYQGLRQPIAGVDSVAVFVEGNPAIAEDDAWVRAGIAGVAVGTCTDGTSGIALSTSWESGAVAAAAAPRMETGGPVRVFEIMELQYYPAGGQSWLGMRSVSRGEAIQPLIGPLADSTAAIRGFTLGYLDRNDNATAALNDVRAITIGLRGVSRVDSLTLSSQVTLRNMLRP